MADALVAARLVHFATVMLVFGSLAFRVYAMGGAAMAGFEAWLGRVVVAGAVTALASALAVLACVAASMAGAASAALDPGTIAAVLGDTDFGHVWSVHLAAAALLAGISGAKRRRGLQLALATLVLASLGWVGHAAMVRGAAGLAHLLNQTLHLLAAGLWLGGLVPLGWLIRQARRGPGTIWHDALRAALPPFSRMGSGAVGLLALTGAVNTVWLVGSVGALFATPYGRLLTVKLALFLTMVAIALGNRFRLAPRLLAGSDSVDALARAVVAEQALGLAILAVVSLLGTWAPAAHGGAM